MGRRLKVPDKEFVASSPSDTVVPLVDITRLCQTHHVVFGAEGKINVPPAVRSAALFSGTAQLNTKLVVSRQCGPFTDKVHPEFAFDISPALVIPATDGPHAQHRGGEGLGDPVFHLLLVAIVVGDIVKSHNHLRVQVTSTRDAVRVLGAAPTNGGEFLTGRCHLVIAAITDAAEAAGGVDTPLVACTVVGAQFTLVNIDAPVQGGGALGRSVAVGTRRAGAGLRFGIGAGLTGRALTHQPSGRIGASCTLQTNDDGHLTKETWPTGLTPIAA